MTRYTEPAPRLCQNPDCQTPLTMRQDKYCSKRCSSKIHNGKLRATTYKALPKEPPTTAKWIIVEGSRYRTHSPGYEERVEAMRRKYPAYGMDEK